MNNKKLITILFLLAFIGATGLFYLTTKEKENKTDTSHTKETLTIEELSNTSMLEPSDEPSNNPMSKEELPIEQMIFVYICGQIMTPGVYEVSEKARVVDVVEKAGGFTTEAMKEAVNLARPLCDGEQIYIPSVEETEQGLVVERINETTSNQEGLSGGSKVNINSATEQQLMELPGIGQAKAKSIISYRETSGKFEQIEDIMKIEGIKEGVFQKIKDKITVR